MGVNKAAILERESFEEFADEERKLLAFSGVKLIMRSIDKGIFLHGMTVKVTIEVNIILF